MNSGVKLQSKYLYSDDSDQHYATSCPKFAHQVKLIRLS